MLDLIIVFGQRWNSQYYYILRYKTRIPKSKNKNSSVVGSKHSSEATTDSDKVQSCKRYFSVSYPLDRRGKRQKEETVVQCQNCCMDVVKQELSIEKGFSEIQLFST